MAPRTEKRTQIYLTADQHRRAQALARQKNTSLAAIVREALDHYLQTAEGEEASWDDDPALALLGSLQLPPRSESALNDDIDHRVYGNPDGESA